MKTKIELNENAKALKEEMQRQYSFIETPSDELIAEFEANSHGNPIHIMANYFADYLLANGIGEVQE
jgi:hypothetical protein